MLKNATSIKKKLILAIDQGTTSSRVALIDKNLNIVDIDGTGHKQISKHQGWTEHNPEEIFDNVISLVKKIKHRNSNEDEFASVSGISITNQRESTVCWNRKTGKPYCNAIVWHDTRTKDISNNLIKKYGGQDFLRNSCGLPMNTYFSAGKMRWIIDHIPEVNKKVKNRDTEDLCFGTVDSWLNYKLTGNHYTDVTNASRTMLMDLKSLEWNEEALKIFGIPRNSLPKILSSSDYFGTVRNNEEINGLKVTGVIGDQQSACIGHLLNKGEVKNTYGTGGFLLMNTGEDIVHSSHGLLTTALYKREGEKPLYALEGAIEAAGKVITWLKNNLHLFKDFDELRELFNSVKDNGDVYFVTGFSGLFSPHWDDTARGMLIGLTDFTQRGHIVRAAFEAISLRSAEIAHSFEKESGLKIKALRVDGGLVNSNEFLQTQSNILGTNVLKPANHEITILGSAIVAGLEKNAGLWKDFHDVEKAVLIEKEFHPEWTQDHRNQVTAKWNKAIIRSKNWH